jgi:hypothetical protein
MPRQSPEDRLIDWVATGLNFRRAGIRLAEISRALTKNRTTVYDWLNNGVEPNYSDGTKLIWFANNRGVAVVRRNTVTLFGCAPIQTSDNSAFVGEEL